LGRSILIYLADKYDTEGKLLPKAVGPRTECINWLMWQMGSAPFLGGGFGHFYNYAPTKIEYAINRYAMETKRQLDVLNRHLADGRKYICGAQYTIADMAIYPWYGGLVQGNLYGDAKTFLNTDEDYPHVVAWAQRVSERPSMKRGRMVNRSWGTPAEQLHERHDRSDFQSKTQDKLQKS
jgi:GST-like protein